MILEPPVATSVAQQRKLTLARPGDTVWTKQGHAPGWIGRKVGLVRESVFCASTLQVFRPRQGVVDPHWGYHQLRSNAVYREANSSGKNSIGLKELKELPFVLPPTSEQRMIVAAIENAFRQIEAIETELDAIDRLSRSLRLASSHDAFAFGDDVERLALSDVADVQSGITKNSKPGAGAVEVPYLSTANVQAGRLDLANVKTMAATPAQVERHRLVRDDVLVLEGGDPDKVGRGWLWDDSIAGCLHQNHVYAIRVDRDRLLPRFLAHYVNAPQARADFLSRAKQTTGIASVNKTQLKALPVPVPSLDVQLERITALESLDVRAAAVSDTVASVRTGLRQTRSAVLHAALVGGLLHAGRELGAPA